MKNSTLVILFVRYRFAFAVIVMLSPWVKTGALLQDPWWLTAWSNVWSIYDAEVIVRTVPSVPPLLIGRVGHRCKGIGAYRKDLTKIDPHISPKSAIGCCILLAWYLLTWPVSVKIKTLSFTTDGFVLGPNRWGSKDLGTVLPAISFRLQIEHVPDSCSAWSKVKTLGLVVNICLATTWSAIGAKQVTVPFSSVALQLSVD